MVNVKYVQNSSRVQSEVLPKGSYRSFMLYRDGNYIARFSIVGDKIYIPTNTGVTVFYQDLEDKKEIPLGE